MPKTLEIGTISSGTMRPEDLIPAFTDALRQVDEKTAESFRGNYPDVYAVLDRGDSFYDEDPDVRDGADWLLETLFDALSDCCPEGYYFGSHPGDGSDYGVWPVTFFE